MEDTNRFSNLKTVSFDTLEIEDIASFTKGTDLDDSNNSIVISDSSDSDITTKRPFKCVSTITNAYSENDICPGKEYNKKRTFQKKEYTIPKSMQLMKYLRQYCITDRRQFDSRPPSETDEFITLNNLNALLTTGFNQVSRQLENWKFDPFIFKNKFDGTDEGYYEQFNTMIEFSSNKIMGFLTKHNRMSIEQAVLLGKMLFKVINKECYKKNCIWILGPSNTGKTTFIQSLVDTYFSNCVGRPSNLVTTNFPFGDKRVILCEEPNIHVILWEEPNQYTCKKYRSEEFDKWRELL